MCLPSFCYYMVAGGHVWLSSYSLLCSHSSLARSRSSIHFEKVVKIGSKFSKYHSYVTSTISVCVYVCGFVVAAHYSCGWYELKLLKRGVISLVNIITTIYYHSTKVITFSFSVAYTHHQDYLWRRNSSCLFSVSEWKSAKFEYIQASLEWQTYE